MPCHLVPPARAPRVSGVAAGLIAAAGFRASSTACAVARRRLAWRPILGVEAGRRVRDETDAEAVALRVGSLVQWCRWAIPGWRRRHGSETTGGRGRESIDLSVPAPTLKARQSDPFHIRGRIMRATGSSSSKAGCVV